MNLDALAALLPADEIERNVPLAALTSFRIGGTAAIVYRPKTTASLVNALAKVRAHSCPMHILGNGSNVLAPDAGFDGLILRLDAPREKLIIEGNRVLVDAGEATKDFVAAALAAGRMGVECLCGIPGTVGGAIAMNAGAYGQEISEHLKSVTVLHQGEVKTIEVAPADFGVRKSRFSAPDYIVLSAEFHLPADDGGAQARCRDCTCRRESRQPLQYPSGGSVFKRPVGHFAGGLIEACGLKGVSVGGAQVSTQHAGFIINTGNATERDVLTLIAHIQDTVYERTGVRLERELKRLCEV